MLGWGRRLSSENGAHPGMGQAGVTSRLLSLTSWEGKQTAQACAIACLQQSSPWPLVGEQVPGPESRPSLSRKEKVGVLNSKQSFSVVARLSPSASGLLSPGHRRPSLPTLD